MAERSEQLQSHRFTRLRVTAALAVRDPDPIASPMRRSAATAFAGVMLAVVALAAVAAYGVLRPGDDTTWRDGRSVIIERETGARFVYRDGELHPALNYTSALLILGGSQPATVIVSHAALAGVPRGVPLGIPGAPDSLPAPADLLTGPWTLCSRLAGTTAESLLAVGGPVTANGAAPQPVGPGAGVLAADPTGADHLLWHGRRFAIDDAEVVLTALGWRDRTPVPMAAAVLNAIPTGSDLAPIRIGGRGGPSVLAGHRVGDVLVATNQSGQKQFGLVVAAGLAPITQLQADLLLADPANGLGGTAVPVTPAAFAAAVAAPSRVPTGDAAPPASTPELVAPDSNGGVCVSFVDVSAPVVLSVTAGRPVGSGEAPAVRAGVDWVAVPPGRGAIVDSLTTPGAPGGLLGVVSDLGVLFPVPSSTVLATLGYSGVAPHRLPSALVALLPRGNALDPTAATVAA